MRAEIGTNVGLEIVEKKNIVTLLKPGELGARLDFKVWNPLTGKILRQDSRKSESFVQQFLQMLYIQMSLLNAAAAMSVRDTGNTLRNVYWYGVNGSGTMHLDVLDAAADANYGIVVGTGNTAPTISDYKLQTLIAHGVGAGAMQ